MGNKLGVFLAGGLVGAVAALLCAPRTGSETRNMVAEKANAVWGEAQELGAQTASTAQQVVEEVAGPEAATRTQSFAQDAVAKGQNVVSAVASKGQEIYGAAASRVQEAKSGVKPAPDGTDDLREKIEAAYGPDFLYQEAVNETYPQALVEAIGREDIAIAGTPTLTVESIGSDGLTFTAPVVAFVFTILIPIINGGILGV